MVQAYCLADPVCANRQEVKNIVSKLVAMLNENCDAQTEAQTHKMLIALKGIGNAGHSDSASSVLSTCAKNTKTGTEIRLAAIEAFRRQSCFDSVSILRASYDYLHDCMLCMCHVYFDSDNHS